MGYISWPLVALVLGLVFILAFRKPIARLLDRTKKIGTKGLEASASGQETGIERQTSPADELLKVFDNALLVQREDLIRTELDKRNIEGAERERILLKFLAASYLAFSFERAYAFIFGSQIHALQELNARGASGMAAAELESFHQLAAAIEPEFYANYTFEQWLAFLQSFQLVSLTNERVTITLEGREFLKYLIQEGFSLSKGG